MKFHLLEAPFPKTPKGQAGCPMAALSLIGAVLVALARKVWRVAS